MRHFILIMTLFLSYCSRAQNHLGDSWEIGVYGYRIDLGQFPIVHDTVMISPIIFLQGKSNLCDSSGALLYMSTGWDIYNKSGVLIEDGDSLTSKDLYAHYSGVNSYSQCSIFLPMDSGKAYFVSATCNDTMFSAWQGANVTSAPFNILAYSIIDQYANNGQGKVVERMHSILENTSLNKGGMMACKHSNGKDWWLIKTASDSIHFYTFLFTQDSVYNYGVQKFPYYQHSFSDFIGQIVFNREGNKVAIVNSNSPGKLVTMDFDRCYGVLSNFNLINNVPVLTNPSGSDTTALGVAFSPNGRFIYVAKFSYILQYDTEDSSWYQVSNWDTSWSNFAGYTLCALGVDDKIYFGAYHGTSKELSVVDNPDVKGIGCNFCRKCLRAKSSTGYMSIPPCMPNYELGAKTCFPMNVVNETDDTDWSFYPNPVSHTIHMNNAKGKTKVLLDAWGRILFSTTSDNIDVSRLVNGLYYLRCGISTKKLLIE